MRRDRGRRGARALATALLVAAMGAGCDDAACARTSDCPSGQTCSATGGCVGGVDAAPPDGDGDAATVDASDAATLDAGDGDAATLDAGDGDAATLDAGATVDAATLDAGDAALDAAATVDAAAARLPPWGPR